MAAAESSCERKRWQDPYSIARRPSQILRDALALTRKEAESHPPHPIHWFLWDCYQHDKCNRGQRMRCCDYSWAGHQLFSALIEPWGYATDEKRQCMWYYDQKSEKLPSPRCDIQRLILRPFRHDIWFLEGPRKPTDKLRILGSLDITVPHYRQYLYDLRFADFPQRQALLRDLPGRLSFSHRPPRFLFNGVASSQLEAVSSKKSTSSSKENLTSAGGATETSARMSTDAAVASPQARHARKMRARIARNSKPDPDLRRQVLVDCANTRVLPSKNPQGDKLDKSEGAGKTEHVHELDRSENPKATVDCSDYAEDARSSDAMELCTPAATRHDDSTTTTLATESSKPVNC